jgi:hypothetical protein
LLLSVRRAYSSTVSAGRSYSSHHRHAAIVGNAKATETNCFEVKVQLAPQLAPLGERSKSYNIVGEVANRCEIAAGAKIKITLRDEDGRVIGDTEFWPASIKNIAPNDAYGFHYHIDAIDNQVNINTYQVRIIDVRTWK